MKLFTPRVIFYFIVCSLAVIIFTIGTDTKVVGEVPCVDGQNRVNLEGIMCEDKQSTFFGLHSSWGVIPMVLVILLAAIPMFMEELE